MSNSHRNYCVTCIGTKKIVGKPPSPHLQQHSNSTAETQTHDHRLHSNYPAESQFIKNGFRKLQMRQLPTYSNLHSVPSLRHNSVESGIMCVIPVTGY